jgi:hypothetical protein
VQLLELSDQKKARGFPGVVKFYFHCELRGCRTTLAGATGFCGMAGFLLECLGIGLGQTSKMSFVTSARARQAA